MSIIARSFLGLMLLISSRMPKASLFQNKSLRDSHRAGLGNATREFLHVQVWTAFCIQAKFLPISSSSEVMDLDLSAIAGVLSLLLCWGTGGGRSSQSGSGFTYSNTPGCSKLILTFLSRAVIHVRVAGNHDDLDHEAVATLPDHVDHLSVTNLHHILSVDLGR